MASASATRSSRGIKLDTRLRGAWVGYEHVELADGAGINDVTPGGDPNAPLAKPGKQGWDVSNEWDFTLDRRIDFNGVQSGYRYMLTYERALPSLGSDFHYYSVGLYTVNAIKLLERHDLVLRGSLNVGHNLPFQQEFTTGGTAMRGWLNDQFRGDLKVAATAEYSFPLFGIDLGEKLGTLSLRGLGFWDSRVHDVHVGRQSRPQLSAERNAARARTVQELGRRRHALLL